MYRRRLRPWDAHVDAGDCRRGKQLRRLRSRREISFIFIRAQSNTPHTIANDVKGTGVCTQGQASTGLPRMAQRGTIMHTGCGLPRRGAAHTRLAPRGPGMGS